MWRFVHTLRRVYRRLWRRRMRRELHDTIVPRQPPFQPLAWDSPLRKLRMAEIAARRGGA